MPIEWCDPDWCPLCDGKGFTVVKVVERKVRGAFKAPIMFEKREEFRQPCSCPAGTAFTEGQRGEQP
jgi:hypothetical protein